jgi:hypothetical protein
LIQLSSDCVPLLVGITGHHELEPADEPALRESVRSLLDEIAKSAPHTRVVALSSLESGAGLLGAEVALDAGVPVIACIPAPREICERHFTEPDALRFRAALERVSRVAVLGAAETGARSATGWYLAFHSHVLVALWDGCPPRNAGGTGDVVQLRETGLAPARWTPELNLPGDADPMPVFVVIARRRGAPPPADAGTVQKRYPRRFSGDRRARENFDASVERLDRYNADLAARACAPADPSGLAGLMVLTDAAANHLQRRALHQLRALYGISLVALAVQLGFAGKLDIQTLKIGTLAAAFIAYRIARNADLENRYQDYRALAEGLRVQIAWNAVGTHTEYVDPFYMRMQQSELQWIRMALRAAALVASAEQPARDERIAVDWVRQQWRYYHRAALRDEHSARAYRRIGKALQYAGVATMAVAAMLLLPAFRALPSTMLFSTQHLATSLTALVGAAAALFGSYADKRGYSANAKRYDRMFGVFDRALRRLHWARSNAADTVPILHDVGREALAEQAEWLLARRERPLRVVR